METGGGRGSERARRPEAHVPRATDMAAEAHEVTVRDATRDDMRAIHAMIHELASYEGVPDGPQLTVEDLIEDGFESSPAWFFALVAERRGAVVGYALCNRAYSSWTRRALYLEDLYVAAAARRSGVGRRLLAAVCRAAAAARVSRLDWHVLESNAPALAFYERHGARDLRRSEGRAAMRLDAPAIQRLAREAAPPASPTAPAATPAPR